MFLYHKTLIPTEVNGPWVTARQNGSVSVQGANLWPTDFFDDRYTKLSSFCEIKSFYGHSVEGTKENYFGHVWEAIYQWEVV